MKSLKERFDAKVEQIPFSECWLWSGYRMPCGYGQLGLGTRQEGLILAHRAAYMLYVGDLPDDLCVLHLCHNGRFGCVTPDHLFLGTRQDNNRHGAEDGVSSRRKLTAEQVREIKAVPPYYGRGRDMAKKYGVHEATISAIYHGRNWGLLR